MFIVKIFPPRYNIMYLIAYLTSSLGCFNKINAPSFLDDIYSFRRPFLYLVSFLPYKFSWPQKEVKHLLAYLMARILTGDHISTVQTTQRNFDYETINCKKKVSGGFSSAECGSIDLQGQQSIGHSLCVGSSVACAQQWTSTREILGYILVIVGAF